MKRKLAIGAAAALALLGIVAWGLGWFSDSPYSADPAVAELQQLRDEQFARRDQMSEAQRQSARADFGQRMQGLTEEQRQACFESSAPMFMKMFAAEIDRFNALPPDEQQAEMDRRIDAMLARGGPGGPPRGNFQPPDPERFDQMRKRMLDFTTPDQRAKFESYMTKFGERLKQRGINPGPGGGFF